MKKAIAIFLLFVFTISLVSRIGIYIGFKLNQEFISKNLCENRLKKESKCQGKCFLAKQMKKHAHEDPKPNLPDLKTEDCIIHSSDYFNFNPEINTKEDWFTFYKSNYFFKHTSSVFHPPSFSFSIL